MVSGINILVMSKKEINYRLEDDFWYEYTYDESGNKLTYKNLDGNNISYIY